MQQSTSVSTLVVEWIEIHKKWTEPSRFTSLHPRGGVDWNGDKWFYAFITNSLHPRGGVDWN